MDDRSRKRFSGFLVAFFCVTSLLVAYMCSQMTRSGLEMTKAPLGDRDFKSASPPGEVMATQEPLTKSQRSGESFLDDQSLEVLSILSKDAEAKNELDTWSSSDLAIVESNLAMLGDAYANIPWKGAVTYGELGKVIHNFGDVVDKPEFIAFENSFCGTDEPLGHTIKTILFATDREPKKAYGTLVDFSNERNLSGLTYGEAQISIPNSHKSGHIDKVGRVEALLGRTGPDFQMLLTNLQEKKLNDFIAAAARSAAASSDVHALIFIHGFNNSFSDAALRAGQLSNDLGFVGPTILYSWASNGTYSSDAERVNFTIPRLTDFLNSLVSSKKFKEVSIIAHSMGSRALAGALSEFAKRHSETKFNQIILAAPDIDEQTFSVNIAPFIKSYARRFTIYTSVSDRAIQVSGIYNANNSRLGSIRRPISGFELVDISEITCEDMFSHSCFAQAHQIIMDINLLLTYNSEPKKRMLKEAKGHWALVKKE